MLKVETVSGGSLEDLEEYMTPPVLLEVSGLTKHFGGVAALSDGQFTLQAGSVHALCGGGMVLASRRF